MKKHFIKPEITWGIDQTIDADRKTVHFHKHAIIRVPKGSISQEVPVFIVMKDVQSAKPLQQTVLPATLVFTSADQYVLLVETVVFPAQTLLAVFPVTLGLILTLRQAVVYHVLLSSLPAFSALTLHVWSALQV